MQRAAASSNRSPSTTASTPIRDAGDPPSAKRQKLTDSESSTPGTPTFSAPRFTDLTVVSTTIAAEERSRSQARLRSAAPGGETEWILNLPGANGSTNGNQRTANGSADLMQEDEEVGEDEIWQDHTVGRRSYGGFKRNKSQVGPTSSKHPSDDEELSEADISDAEPGVSQNSRRRPRHQDWSKGSTEEKKWQAMDRMNLKGQSHISGFSPKRTPDDRTSKVKKKPRYSSTS
jgi:hypothetical protein